jgi:hypothetical protein
MALKTAKTTRHEPRELVSIERTMTGGIIQGTHVASKANQLLPLINTQKPRCEDTKISLALF